MPPPKKTIKEKKCCGMNPDGNGWGHSGACESVAPKKTPVEEKCLSPMCGRHNPPALEDKAEWEEEFDKMFPYKIQGAPKHTKLKFIDRELKSFIQSLLQKQRSELIAAIEGMKRHYEVDPKIVQHRNRRDIRITKAKVFNYNEALSDAVNLIKEKE